MSLMLKCKYIYGFHDIFRFLLKKYNLFFKRKAAWEMHYKPLCLQSFFFFLYNPISQVVVKSLTCFNLITF